MVNRNGGIKKLLIFVVSFSLAGLLWYGCQVQARYRVSVPMTIVNSICRFEDGKFDCGDIELAFGAWNKRGSGFMILPVPMPIDVNDEAKPPFRLTIELVPHRSGFRFDSARTFLSSLRGERISSAGILGGSQIKDNTLIATIPPVDNRMFELDRETRLILNLAFDIPPPDPAEPFTVEIEGLSLNQKPYALPRIPFQEKMWSGTLR